MNCVRAVLGVVSILLLPLIGSAQCRSCGPVVPPVPQVVYRPVVTYQPYRLVESEFRQRQFRTPIRRLLFPGRWHHRYEPVQADQAPVTP